MSSEIVKIVSPNLDYKIRLADTEDNTIFEAEALYLDHLLAQAQKDIDISEDNAVIGWLPKFSSLVCETFDVTISDTDAFFIAKECVKLMWDLKKKYEAIST
jgi:hypothetical protein